MVFTDIISCRRLHWFRYAARMDYNCFSKYLLLEWLPQLATAWGNALLVYGQARFDRIDKSGAESSSVSIAAVNRFHCDGCQRSFSRPQDKARRSCSSVRSRRAAASMII